MKSTFLLFIAAGAALCSCGDSVESPDFTVGVPAGLNVAAGETVRFVFGGNPDYITFFSGEDGSDYAASDRYEADIAGLELSCGMRQQYNDTEYLDRQLVYVYASTDFNGDYSAGSLNAATWIPLTGVGANSLPVPVALSAAAATCSGSVDLGEYVGCDAPFYLAFLYNAPGRANIPAANGGGRYIVRPRVDVTDLRLKKRLADGSLETLDNAATQFGMRPVYELSYKESNFRVTDDGMLFQPVQAVTDPLTGREPDERVWMVSARIDPRKVSPDRGLAIKSAEARLNFYEHSYKKPGEYTATFVATNANLWDSKRCVKQLSITVR